MTEQKTNTNNVTVQVPKTFLTYLLGILSGGFLGAAIVCTAAQIFYGASGLIIISCLLIFFFGLSSWGTK